MFKTLLIAGVMSALLSSTAHSTILLSDNFATENGGATALNYSAFQNFSVVGGSVDLVHTGDGYGINCYSGAACVDLDGTTNMGGFLNSNNFSVNAGQLVTLTAYVSGNQRSAAAAADDDLNLGFATSGISQISYGNATGPGLPSALSGAFMLDPTGDGFGYDYSGDPGSPPTNPIAFNAPYQAYTLSFIPAQSGTIQAFIGTDSADNVGPVLGSVNLAVSAAPEPSMWAMMFSGLAILGLALRDRRRRNVSVAAF